MIRQSYVERETNETKIRCQLTLETYEASKIKTGIGFFDHMLEQVARHGFMQLILEVKGDLEVDCHHTIEDVGIVIGKAISKALGSCEGIVRYGSSMIPMDEVLMSCAIDLSGRPYYCSNVVFTKECVGGMDLEMVDEFFRAIATHSGMNLHFHMFEGINNHHMVEGMFKAFAKALSNAIQFDDRIKGTLSTKGVLEGIG
ncbi:imidazoleglycerol-phosphate dehydratase HisB [Vallitalea okinawensis]|uniref:imidazoleglycerol-phosphate dehydratase HisB n=1 Tax=Vallitalea okinawensis TaxID=2078660 RepID=UPI000CFDAEF9|nr:imidazoleglycerol-phosphate dehydratase HisB [Vallitalea okinawensis]